MILFLIFLSIMIVLAIVGVICVVRGQDDGAEHSFITSGIFLAGLAIMGIIIGCTRGPLSQQETRIQLQETISELNSTRIYAEQELAKGNIVVVNQYNTNVRNFRTEISTEQLLLNNPWVNWFHSPVYNEVNLDDIQYIIMTVNYGEVE